MSRGQGLGRGGKSGGRWGPSVIMSTIRILRINSYEYLLYVDAKDTDMN